MAKKTMMQSFDFSDVRTFVKVPEGTYTARVKDVEEKDFASGNSGFTVQFEILSGLGKGGTVYDNYPIMEQSLWKIKQLLECLGFKVPDKLRIDLMTMVGKKCTLDIIVEEYNGKDIPRVEKMYPFTSLTEEDDYDSYEDDEEDAERPAPRKSKKSKAKKQKPEPEDEPEDSEDESFDEDSQEFDEDIEEVEAEELPEFEDDEEDEDDETNPFIDDEDDWDDDDED